MKLGSLIKSNRLANGITQQKLAEKLNVDIRTIQKWESGERIPDAKNILKLIETLELNNKEVEKSLE